MSGTRQDVALASYRDAVAGLIEAGEAVGGGEGSIDELNQLTAGQKGALWPFAFSLGSPDAEDLDARTPVRALRGSPAPLEFDARGLAMAERSDTMVERLAGPLNRSHPRTDAEVASCPT